MNEGKSETTRSGMSHDTTLAERIADALLTNGFGDVAARLVLRAPDGRELGGWSRAPIVQLVQRELENHGR